MCQEQTNIKYDVEIEVVEKEMGKLYVMEFWGPVSPFWLRALAAV